jgi:small conductance mechanosensitive channel
LRRMKGILPDPRPQVLISELGDSTVQLSFLAWIDQRETDFLKARSEAIRLVKAAFDAAGIEMPEPIYRIHLRDAASLKPGEGGEARPEPAPTPREAAATAEASDVTVDHAIDEQVAEDLRTSEEENLLKKGG